MNSGRRDDSNAPRIVEIGEHLGEFGRFGAVAVWARHKPEGPAARGGLASRPELGNELGQFLRLSAN